MDIGEKLFLLLLALKEHKRPRDDTLLPKLSTLLSDYCLRYGFNPNLASKGIFDLEQLQDVDSDILSFFLQMAGLCENINENDLQKIEKFLIEVMRSGSSHSSILCGWIEAMKRISSKYMKPISEEILSHICNCLLDKRYFVQKTTLSLMDILIENSLDKQHFGEVEFILSEVVLNFKKNSNDVSALQTILSLMEKIFLRNKTVIDLEIPISWKAIFQNGIIEILGETICKISKGETLELFRILNVLRGMMDVVKEQDEVCKIFERLIFIDEKIKVLHVAAWMMESPSFEHLHNNLEHLILSPIRHEVDDATSATEGFNFSNSSFDSDILRISFDVVGKQKLTRPDTVFDLCLTFLRKNCLEVRGQHHWKCIHACLDAAMSQASKLDEHPKANQKSCLVKLLLALKEDHLAVTRTFKIIETILSSYLSNNKMDCNDIENGGDHDDDCSELFSVLHQLIKSNTWDIRDSIITFIGLIYKSQVSLDIFQKTITHNLHRIIWESLMDEEPYVRASAVDSLSMFISSSHKLGFDNEISQKVALEKVISMMLNDEEAFARRSSSNFIINFIISNHELLFPSFQTKNSSTTSDPNLQSVGYLVEVLAVSLSKDLDWEVKIPILMFFKKLILEILFQHLWSHYRCKQQIQINKTEVNENVHRMMHNMEMEVVSMAFKKIFEAKDECDSTVREVADSIVRSIHEKLNSTCGVDANCSTKVFQDFVSCFCGGKDDIINQCIESSLIVEDKEMDLIGEISSVLEDIETCLVPCFKPTDEYLTSDEEEYLDFGMVDCY